MQKFFVLVMIIALWALAGLSSTSALNVYDVQIAGRLLGNVDLSPIQIQAVSPNDPFYAQQLSLRRLNIHRAWDITTGSTLVVAVIDTGININHQDLSGRVWTNTDEIPNNNIDDDNNGYVDDVHGYNFFDNNANIADGHGHGTGIASIIAANTNNRKGVAGIDWLAKVMVLKALDNLGGGDFEDVSEAVRYAVDNGASVINMSFGSNSNSNTMAQAIDYAISHNVVVVAATGNNGDGQIFYPARYPEVISVGSIDFLDGRSDFSNYGANLDLVAPGEKVVMAGLQSSKYIEGAGSSFAAAQVSGIALLLLANDPALTPSQIHSILTSTANTIGSGESIFFGFGRPDALSALQYKAKPSLAVTHVEKNTALADGIDAIKVSATLSDSLGRLLANSPVQLNLTGSGNIINNQLVAFGQQVSLGNTDSNGYISFDISSIIAEAKTLQLVDPSTNIQVANQITLRFTAFSPNYKMQWLQQSAYPNLSLGEEVVLWVDLKNIGNTVWTSEANAMTDRGQIRLGTDKVKDRNSVFYNSSWLSQNRVTNMTPSLVKLGEIGRFEFTIKATQTGSFREYFSVVAEEIAWLNDLGIYWDINVGDFNIDVNVMTQVNRDASSYGAVIQTKTSNPTIGTGEDFSLSVTFRNNGSALWLSSSSIIQDIGEIRLGTALPHDRSSNLYHADWILANRLIASDVDVSPNSDLTFEFIVKAPSQPGTYTENFQLVAEHITWFGSVFGWVINVV